MKERTSVKGFTLIELLVVIAIIAILAGILLPAVIGAFKKASDAQALSEVKSIETAVKQYFNEYGRYPFDSGANGDKMYGKVTDMGNADNANMIRTLRSVAGDGNTDHKNNPRRIVFLEVNERSLDSSGNFLDPWGSQYFIGVDTDFDNQVEWGGAMTVIQARNVAVFSLGVNQAAGGTNEAKYITSWK